MDLDEKTTGAINDVERQFIARMSSSDYAGASFIFAEDAVLLAPTVEAAHGRSSIQAFLGRDGRIKGMDLTPTSRKSLAAGVVREVGALRLTLLGNRQMTREIAAKYALIWRLQNESWAIETLMWNRSEGAEAGAGLAGQGEGRGGRFAGAPGAGGQGRAGAPGRFQRGGGEAPSPYSFQPPGAGGAPVGRFQPGGGVGQGGGAPGRRRLRGDGTNDDFEG